MLHLTTPGTYNSYARIVKCIKLVAETLHLRLPHKTRSNENVNFSPISIRLAALIAPCIYSYTWCIHPRLVYSLSTIVVLDTFWVLVLHPKEREKNRLATQYLGYIWKYLLEHCEAINTVHALRSSFGREYVRFYLLNISSLALSCRVNKAMKIHWPEALTSWRCT